MDGIGKVQLGISTARPGDLVPFGGHRPVWRLGRLWTVPCGVGQLQPIRELYTAKLNWLLPAAMIPALAIVDRQATGAHLR